MNDDIKPVNNDFQPTQPPPSFQPSSSPQPQPVAPFTPPAKKSRKKLWLIAVIIIVIIVAIGGGAAYALWYNNPEKVVADAVGNVIKSPSSINSAVFESQTKSGEKLSITFKTQTNNPKLAGSLSADVKIDSKDLKINLGGAGMITESGDFYFKIDNAQEVVAKLLATDYGKLYASNPALQKAIKDFAKKIDGRWIKVDTKDITNMLDSQGYKTERQCYQKALTTFYDDKDQQNQVTDAYNNNKFIVVDGNNKTSKKINGVDSKGYDISFKVQKFYDFGDAAEKADIIKALKKCDTNQNNFEESAKPTQAEIEESQKEADKTKLTLWVSKWGHNLTGIDASHNDSDGTHTTFTMKTDFKAKPQLKNPKDFLSLTELQDDLTKIYTTAAQGSFYSEVQAGAQAKAREAKQKADAAEAFAAQQTQ